jgi:hypothetical protein
VSLLTRHYLPWRKSQEERAQRQAKFDKRLASVRAEVIWLHDTGRMEEIFKPLQEKLLKAFGFYSGEEAEAQLAKMHANLQETLRKLGVNPEAIKGWGDRRFAGRLPWE